MSSGAAAITLQIPPVSPWACGTAAQAIWGLPQDERRARIAATPFPDRLAALLRDGQWFSPDAVGVDHLRLDCAAAALVWNGTLLAEVLGPSPRSAWDILASNRALPPRLVTTLAIRTLGDDDTGTGARVWRTLIALGRLPARDPAMVHALALALRPGPVTAAHRRGADRWLAHRAAPAADFARLWAAGHDHWGMQILRHPHVPPALQMAALALPDLPVDQLDAIVMHPRARRDPILRQALDAALNHHPVEGADEFLLPSEPVATYARRWRRVWNSAPHAAVHALHLARPAQRATLTRDDLARIATHPDPDIHTVALALLPHVQPAPRRR